MMTWEGAAGLLRMRKAMRRSTWDERSFVRLEGSSGEVFRWIVWNAFESDASPTHSWFPEGTSYTPTAGDLIASDWVEASPELLEAHARWVKP